MLIASEDVLGPAVDTSLKRLAAGATPGAWADAPTNVRLLQPLDCLKLLRTHSQLGGDSITCSNGLPLVSLRPDFITDAWLIDLWNYILATNSLCLFCDSFPLLPGNGYSRLIRLVLSFFRPRIPRIPLYLFLFLKSIHSFLNT